MFSSCFPLPRGLVSSAAAAGKSAEDVAKEIEQRHKDIGYGEREEEAEDALASVAAGERDIVERQVRCEALCVGSSSAATSQAQRRGCRGSRCNLHRVAAEPHTMLASVPDPLRAHPRRVCSSAASFRPAPSFPLQANLPDMRDPRLWMIRCKDGAEAEIMVALVNKYIAKASAPVGAGEPPDSIFFCSTRFK